MSLTNEKNLKGNSKELHVELDTKKKKKGELKKNKKGKLVQMDSQIVDVNQQIEEQDKIENSNKQGKKKKGQKRKKTTEGRQKMSQMFFHILYSYIRWMIKCFNITSGPL